MESLRNAKSGKPFVPEQDDYEFRTAPNSPSPDSSSPNGEHSLFNPDLYHVQNRDDFPILDPGYNSKKRRYIDGMKAKETRQVSHNIAESHLADCNEMNEVSCQDLMKLEVSN